MESLAPWLVFVARVVLEQTLAEAVAAAVGPTLERARLEPKISSALAAAFERAQKSYPCIDGPEVTVEFLGRGGVVAELKKLTDPFVQPDADRLTEEWTETYEVRPKAETTEALLKFLDYAREELRKIPELRRDLADKMILELSQVAVGQNDAIMANQGELLELMRGIVVAQPGHPDERVSRFRAQLDLVAGMINANKPGAAIDPLCSLERQATEAQMPDAVLARIHTLIGVAKLSLGRTDEATDHFERAHDLQPDDNKAKANWALVRYLRGEWREAASVADQVLAVQPDGTNARAVRTWALAQVWGHRNLQALVDEEHLTDTIYLRALGMVFLEAKQYDEAERYLRRCVARDESDVPSRLLLVQTIVEKAIPPLEFTVYTASVTDRTGLLRQASALADEAVSICLAGDNRVLLAEALVSRAATRAHVGDASGADADFQRALDAAPDHPRVLLNRGLHAMNQGDWARALSHLEELPLSLDPPLPLRTALAHCYVATHQPDRALSVLPATPQPSEQWILRARALVQLGKTDEVRALNDGLLSSQQDAKALRIAAFICIALDDTDGAIRALAASHGVADESLREQTAIELGMTLLRERRIREAVEWFGKAEDIVLSRADLLSPYVQALYHAGLYADAYRKAADARARGVVDPIALDIEAFIAEALGDLPAAAAIYEQLMTLQPHVVMHKIHLMRVRLRAGDNTSVRTVLESINTDSVDEPLALVQLGEVYALLGERWKGLQLAYRGLRAGRELAEVHLAYIHLFLAHDHELDDLRPDEIRADSAALLLEGGRRHWVKILGTVAAAGPYEYSVESETGKRLLGHRVGDVLALNPGAIDEHLSTILEIQDIHVRALQESLEEYQTRFPSDLSLQRIDSTEGGLNKVLIATVGFSERAGEILRLYGDGYLTLEALAQLLRHDEVEVQAGLAETDKQMLRAATGLETDRQVEVQAVRSAWETTLALSAMVTLQRLGLLDSLPRRFEHLNVPQHLLDSLLRQYAMKRQWVGKRRGNMGFDNGAWHIVEISEEATQREVRTYQELLQFARNCCRVVPVSSEHARLFAGEAKEANAIGRVSLATLLVAHQTNTPLMADDLAFRRVAWDEYEVASFCTETYLSDLFDRDLITEHVLVDGRLQLALAGYTGIPIDASVLARSLDSDEHTMQQRARTLALLGEEAITASAATRIAGQLVRKLWLSDEYYQSRGWALDMLLTALARRSEGGKLLARLRGELTALLYVAPLQLMDAQARIDQWMRYHRM